MHKHSFFVVDLFRRAGCVCVCVGGGGELKY